MKRDTLNRIITTMEDAALNETMNSEHINFAPEDIEELKELWMGIIRLCGVETPFITSTSGEGLSHDEDMMDIGAINVMDEILILIGLTAHDTSGYTLEGIGRSQSPVEDDIITGSEVIISVDDLSISNAISAAISSTQFLFNESPSHSHPFRVSDTMLGNNESFTLSS